MAPPLAEMLTKLTNLTKATILTLEAPHGDHAEKRPRGA
jgi:hypothetical protein